MLEVFQERQALEISHVSHMHWHPFSLPSGSAGDGQHNLYWCYYTVWGFRIYSCF